MEGNLFPRSSSAPVFDHVQYLKVVRTSEGLPGMRVGRGCYGRFIL